MEENEVEGFVVEKMALVGGGDGRPRSLGGLLAIGACWNKKKKEMKERDERSYIYIEGENNIIISHHHFPSNECCVSRLRLGKKKPNAGFNGCVQ